MAEGAAWHSESIAPLRAMIAFGKHSGYSFQMIYDAFLSIAALLLLLSTLPGSALAKLLLRPAR